VPAPEGLASFTAAAWDRDVLASPAPVVAAFWAAWCLPCHMAEAAWRDAVRAYGARIRFGLVDYDTEPELAARYEVQGLPTVLVLKGGRVVARRVGLMGRDALRRLLEAHA
jgi:thioredoxin 1